MRTAHIERWEGDKHIIVVDGMGVVGKTLDRHEAEIVKLWLESALPNFDALLEATARDTAEHVRSQLLAVAERRIPHDDGSVDVTANRIAGDIRALDLDAVLRGAAQ